MRRTDGYAPIGSYALIGDGRAAALVALDGAIDWLCLPGLADAAVFAAVLDADHGGHFTLRPTTPYQVTRQYVEDANVLQTTFTTADGVVKVTDSINLQEGRLLPWTELVRRVEGIHGDVMLSWTLEPRFDFGRQAVRWHRHHGVPVARGGPWSLCLIGAAAATATVANDRASGEVRVAQGSRSLLGFAAVRDAPPVLPHHDQVDSRVDRTVEFWRQRAIALRYNGRWRDAVVRSALALQLLIQEETGAIVAAPTMGLPERVGGPLNWDYRYQWVRDASLAMDAFMALGMQAQAHASFAALQRATRHTHPRLQPMYTVQGSATLPDETLDLRGYRDSRPVRVGNGAAGQLQLGCWGELLNTASGYVRDGHLLDDRTAADLTGTVNLLCDLWGNDDSGIWELQGSPRQYTSSKLFSWTALQRARELARDGHLSDSHVGRWQAEQAGLREFAEERCWSERRQSYTFYAGSDELDASVLLGARMGYWRDGDRRLCTTIAALRSELGAGPFLYRYSGASQKENAFVACGFWMVEALAKTGDVSAAGDLMDQLDGATNDVGLLSEEIDPASRELVGNMPQGLSHLSLINAALMLDSAERRDRG